MIKDDAAVGRQEGSDGVGTGGRDTKRGEGEAGLDTQPTGEMQVEKPDEEGGEGGRDRTSKW